MPGIFRDRLVLEAAALGWALQGMAFDTSGAGAHAKPLVTCAGKGGTVAYTVTKASARAGLAAGDQLVAVYAKCDMTGQGAVYDGTVKLTAKGAVNTLSVSDFTVAYEADLSGLAVDDVDGARLTFTGTMGATINVGSAAGVNSARLTTPVYPGFGVAVSKPSARVQIGLLDGASYELVEQPASRTTSIKLNGNVSLTGLGVFTTVSISTPIALSGSYRSDGRAFWATAGTLDARRSDLDLATHTTISGDVVTVSGDTDRDGTMDTVFNIGWSSLTII